MGSIEINRGLFSKVLSTFPDNYFDWIFIDLAYSYTVTISELEIASRKVKNDGLICGHHYTLGT